MISEADTLSKAAAFVDDVEMAFEAIEASSQSSWLTGMREAMNRAEEYIKPKETKNA
jgi:hypothetical protein